MIERKDSRGFKWIQNEVEEIASMSRVANFIPKRFQSVCKIMNPFYRDLNIQDEQLRWSDCDPNENPFFTFGEKITFRELAHKYNLMYTKEISTWSLLHKLNGLPRYLVAPDEGTMDEGTLQESIKVLKPFTNAPCYSYFDVLKIIHSFPKEDEDHHSHLYKGSLEDSLTLFRSGEFELGSPTYWWPEDKNWCIWTDFDFDFSIVGGSEELVNAFLTNPNLECIEVERNTRVDFDADKHNQLHRENEN